MSLKLKPGVVWGDAYKALVQNCKENRFALPAINVAGTNSLNAVLEAAARNKSDVIVQLSNGGAQFFAGLSLADKHKAMVLGAVSAARHTALMAEEYGVCVVLNTDHANRKLIPWVRDLVGMSEQSIMQTGVPLYSSHMLDLSDEPIGDNLRACEDILPRMFKAGIALEMELGVTGGEEDGIGQDIDEVDNAKLYTQPEEVLAAYDRLSKLGTISIAAAFGNVHGVYAPGNVMLRPEILKASQALVQKTHNLAENPLDFVFHGGSGSDPTDIRAAIDYGVFKMNVDTDTQFAFAKGVGAYVEQHTSAFKYQLHPETGVPAKGIYDPRKWLREGEKSMVDRLNIAFQQLGSVGQSVAS